MQFSELTEMLKGSCLYLGILLLCGHSVFMVNLEMYKAIIIYIKFCIFKHIFVCTMLEGIEIGHSGTSFHFNILTCEILIALLHNKDISVLE